MFKTVALPEDGTMRIQHDYMSAYFDFFTGQEEGFKVARRIVQKYEDYPILAWRIPFLEILDQLNEFDGEQFVEMDDEENKSNEALTEEQRRLRYKKSIKQEPILTFEISETEKATLVVESANFKSYSLKFYIIDAEILFSRTPFLKTSSEEFSYVKPCHIIEKSVDVKPEGDIKPTLTKIQIPEHLKLQNMVIEVIGKGKQLFRTYYASQLKVILTEAYGELKVVDAENNSKPLPSVYVKVYSQNWAGGDAKFYKDGYTDIRGKFDYAQTSGNKLKDVKKFAILILSDTLGSIIKECEPPKDGSKPVSSQGGILVSSETNNLAQQKAERIVNRVNAWKSKKSAY